MKWENNSIIERVKEVIAPFCHAENFEMVHLEFITGQREKILRLFLDKPSGITLDDCVYVSRQLGDLINVHVDNIGSYRLEVSSPGVNRPLNKKEDFIRFTGEKVKIQTHEALENQKNFTGILDTVSEDAIIIIANGKKIEISDHLISKARLAGQ